MSWKSANVAIIENRTTTSMIGLIKGSVTRQNRCQALARSISAASCRSGLTVCSPASSVMAKKGMPRHTLTRIRQPIASVPSPSHRMRVEMTPMFRSTQLNTLNVASNIHCQARVLRTVGTIQGKSIDARTIRLNRK